MNINSISFEDVKNYFNNPDDKIMNFLGSDERVNLPKLISQAIEDIQSCIENEPKQQLGNGDLNFVLLLTLKLLYILTCDKFENSDEFCAMWATLFINYFKAFNCDYSNQDYLLSIINLLQLKNNMARMIFLSDYIIENQRPNDYLTVSKTYINSILEKDLDFKE